MLWSRVGPLVTCIRFDRQESITGLPSVVGVPTELLLPISKNGDKISIKDISVRSLDREDEGEATLTLEIPQSAIYSLQILTDDLALYHAFLGSTYGVWPEPPHSMAKIRVKSAPITLGDDGFIVPDEFSQQTRLARLEKSISHKVKYAVPESSTVRRHGRTAEYEIISRKISRVAGEGNTMNITDIANDLQDLFLGEDVQGVGEPSMTLFEHVQSSHPEIGELAEASEILHDLSSLSKVGPVPDEPGLAVKGLAVPAWASTMHVSFQESGFQRLYNHIIDQQLAPLANEIPPRLRMAREKLARTMAAELILSSSRIELVDLLADMEERTEESQPTQYSRPFHLQANMKGKQRATDAFPGSSQLSTILSSQPMPTPSPSASRATSVISYTSTSSLPSTAARNILSRLNRHVSIDPNKKPQNWATRPLAILAHWDTGADPVTYNYASKLSELEKQRHEESMTDKQRLRAREKAERRLRRQRKEAEKARSGLVSSQPVVMSSQVQRGASSQRGGSEYDGSQFGRGSEVASSPPPPMVVGLGSSQVAPPVVGSSQVMRKGMGPGKRKKRKREGF
jgi:hypothetical protein